MIKYKIPEHEFELSFSRSSGAGGQNVNKVNSKATLHWNVEKSQALPLIVKERFYKKYKNRISEEGVVVIIGQAHRTQLMNTADVIRKLHEMIESISLPPKLRKATKPTKSSVNERIKSKKLKGSLKKFRAEKHQHD